MQTRQCLSRGHQGIYSAKCNAAHTHIQENFIEPSSVHSMFLIAKQSLRTNEFAKVCQASTERPWIRTRTCSILKRHAHGNAKHQRLNVYVCAHRCFLRHPSVFSHDMNCTLYRTCWSCIKSLLVAIAHGGRAFWSHHMFILAPHSRPSLLAVHKDTAKNLKRKDMSDYHHLRWCQLTNKTEADSNT